MTDNFSHKAADWDQPSKIAMTDAFVAAMLQKIQPQQSWKAFELGAGTGLVGLQILPLVDSLVMEDTSEAMLGVLRQKLKGDEPVEIVHGEIFEYTKQDIDFVFSCMAFHHVPDSQAALNHLFKITKTGATVVIGDIRSEDGSFNYFEKIKKKGFENDDLTVKFTNAGLKVLSVKT